MLNSEHFNSGWSCEPFWGLSENILSPNIWNQRPFLGFWDLGWEHLVRNKVIRICKKRYEVARKIEKNCFDKKGPQWWDLSSSFKFGILINFAMLATFLVFDLHPLKLSKLWLLCLAPEHGHSKHCKYPKAKLVVTQNSKRRNKVWFEIQRLEFWIIHIIWFSLRIYWHEIVPRTGKCFLFDERTQGHQICHRKIN